MKKEEGRGSLRPGTRAAWTFVFKPDDIPAKALCHHPTGLQVNPFNKTMCGRTAGI